MTLLPDFLLAAICANPDDDAPRLAFADWCDENGEEERAELVRIQIKIARAIEEDTGYLAWCPRERELLNLHRLSWAGDLPFQLHRTEYHGETDQGLPWKFRRGFVETIESTASDWLAHGDAILAEHPVTEVRLTSRPLPRGDGERSGLWEDPAGKLFTSEDLNEKFQVGDDLITNLLRLRWPSVRTWHLPPVYGESPMAAVYRTLDDPSEFTRFRNSVAR